MSPTLLAAAAENREASPIALVVILLLLVALVFLVRSMNKHLRRVPGSFSRSEQEQPPGSLSRSEQGQRAPRQPEDQ
jgi:hypothetical protein